MRVEQMDQLQLRRHTPADWFLFSSLLFSSLLWWFCVAVIAVCLSSVSCFVSATLTLPFTKTFTQISPLTCVQWFCLNLARCTNWFLQFCSSVSKWNLLLIQLLQQLYLLLLCHATSDSCYLQHIRQVKSRTSSEFRDSLCFYYVRMQLCKPDIWNLSSLLIIYWKYSNPDGDKNLAQATRMCAALADGRIKCLFFTLYVI